MKKYFKFILLLGIVLIFLTGCISELVVPENDVNSPATEGGSTDENPAGGLGTGKGTLKIYLTDAPGDYLEVNIIISKIEGHIAGDGEEGEDKGSWKVLKEWGGGLQVDLIKLEDVSMLLASLELEPNKYTQLRLFLMGGEEDAWVVLDEPEGSEESTSIEFLEIPSSANTGIKLNRPFEIMEGMITKLTIDFDAEKSVIKTGNGKYKMKPVISLSSETYSEEEFPEGLGSVSGIVSYYGGDLGLIGIGGASVSLSGGAYIFANTTTTSGEEGSKGDFSLSNVPVGNYTLNVNADGFNDYSQSIVVGEGVNAVNVVLSFEETGAISGSVVDSGTALAIEGVTVSVELDSVIYSFEGSTETGIEGTFSIEQLPVGIYDLIVSAIGYVDSYISGITVTAGVINNIGVIVLTPSTP